MRCGCDSVEPVTEVEITEAEKGRSILPLVIERKEGAKWKRQLNSWSLPPPLRHQFFYRFRFCVPFPSCVVTHLSIDCTHASAVVSPLYGGRFYSFLFSFGDLPFMPLLLLLPNNTHCQIFKFKLNFITQTDRSKHNISLSFVPFPCSCSVVSQREKEKSETLTVTASQKSIRFQQQQQQQLTMCFSVCVCLCVFNNSYFILEGKSFEEGEK